MVYNICLNGISGWHSAADIYLFLLDVYSGRMICWLSFHITDIAFDRQPFTILTNLSGQSFKIYQRQFLNLNLITKWRSLYCPSDNFKIFFLSSAIVFDVFFTSELLF